jgi:hypothetical protein
MVAPQVEPDQLERQRRGPRVEEPETLAWTPKNGFGPSGGFDPHVAQRIGQPGSLKTEAQQFF